MKYSFFTILSAGALIFSPVSSRMALAAETDRQGESALSNAQKIKDINAEAQAALDALAGQYLDRMDFSKVRKIADQMLELPNLSPQDRAMALMNIGKLWQRQGDNEKARASYQKVPSLNVSASMKTNAWYGIVDTYVAEGDAANAVALSKEHGLNVMATYNKLGQTKEAVSEIKKILDNSQLSDEVRWNAFLQLPLLVRNISSIYVAVLQNDQEVLYETGKKYLEDFLKVDANRALVLLKAIQQANLTTPYTQQIQPANAKFVVWAVPLILKAPKLPAASFGKLSALYIDALAQQNNLEAAQKAAVALADDERAEAAIRTWAGLVAATIASQKDEEIPFLIKKLPSDGKSDAILQAAQTALRTGNTLIARSLYAAYEELFVQQKQATIVCAFDKDAPFDVGSWLKSPLLKQTQNTARLDRPYGDNLQQLLETDSTVTGRNTGVSSEKDTGDTRTDLYMACDARGIHIFFNAFDSQQQEVLDGLLQGGSFEMYFAPGENQPYFTFLPRLPDGPITTGPDSFLTMYPNQHFRIPSTQEGTLQNSILPTGEGFGISIFLSWRLFYDKLPSNGDRWQFESIRWTRAGGRSFAGSQSVHNRSSWGDIIFEGLSPENLNAIKRTILFHAVKKYQQAKLIQNPVGQWADAELGDPEFFQARVLPYLNRLDAYAERVRQDITMSEVNTLFKEAVPGWMEIEHDVAAMRAEYLQDKTFGTL